MVWYNYSTAIIYVSMNNQPQTLCDNGCIVICAFRQAVDKLIKQADGTVDRAAAIHMVIHEMRTDFAEPGLCPQAHYDPPYKGKERL